MTAGKWMRLSLVVVLATAAWPPFREIDRLIILWCALWTLLLLRTPEEVREADEKKHWSSPL